MSPHYLVKNNKSDAASRIVDDIHNTSHGLIIIVRATHFLLGKTINRTLQTRHTVDRCDMDTYFVMYRWSKTFVLQGGPKNGHPVLFLG